MKSLIKPFSVLFRTKRPYKQTIWRQRVVTGRAKLPINLTLGCISTTIPYTRPNAIVAESATKYRGIPWTRSSFIAKTRRICLRRSGSRFLRCKMFASSPSRWTISTFIASSLSRVGQVTRRTSVSCQFESPAPTVALLSPMKDEECSWRLRHCSTLRTNKFPVFSSALGICLMERGWQIKRSSLPITAKPKRSDRCYSQFGNFVSSALPAMAPTLSSPMT